MYKYILSGLLIIACSHTFAFSVYLSDNINKAKIESTCTNLKLIDSVLDLYKIETYKYPSTEEGLAILIQKKLLKKDSYLLDSWDTPYHYKSEDEDVTLISLGPDKKMGGDDDLTLESCKNKANDK